MNMVYKDDTLYVDMVGSIGANEIRMLKSRLYSVLDQYEVDNVIINVKNTFSLNRNLFNSFVRDYHRNYNGHLTIDTK